MAFPQVAAVNGGNDTSDGTNHTVNLPADISSGNLLLVFFASDGIPTIAFPIGWTELFQVQDPGAKSKFSAWYRVADGEEGATITATTSDSQGSAHTSYRITGYSDTPEVETAVTGTSASPNPPELTPTWGAEDTLWIANCGHNDGRETVNAYPTDYTDGRNDRSDTTGGVGVGTARRENNAVSEDPGVFTLSDSDIQWVANIVAIRPGEAVAPGGSVASIMVQQGMI